MFIGTRWYYKHGYTPLNSIDFAKFLNHYPVCPRQLVLSRVAANSATNKMTLTNLATIFGPNLVRPGGAGSEINIAAMDVVTPVSVVLYYLNCPEEYFEESASNRTSPVSTAQGSGGGSGERKGVVTAVVSVAEGRAQWRGSNTNVPIAEQRSPEAKVFRRSRRSSSRGNKTASTSSSRGSASIKNTSTSSVSSLTTPKESVL